MPEIFCRPFPKITSEAVHLEWTCKDEVEGFVCTREVGHSGKHEAGGGKETKVAEWN